MLGARRSSSANSSHRSLTVSRLDVGSRFALNVDEDVRAPSIDLSSIIAARLHPDDRPCAPDRQLSQPASFARPGPDAL